MHALPSHDPAGVRPCAYGHHAAGPSAGAVARYLRCQERGRRDAATGTLNGRAVGTRIVRGRATSDAAVALVGRRRFATAAAVHRLRARRDLLRRELDLGSAREHELALDLLRRRLCWCPIVVSRLDRGANQSGWRRRRGDSVERRVAAAPRRATWIFRGDDESRQRNVGIPWRDESRRRRGARSGDSVETTSRGGATWRFRGETSRDVTMAPRGSWRTPSKSRTGLGSSRPTRRRGRRAASPPPRRARARARRARA